MVGEVAVHISAAARGFDLGSSDLGLLVGAVRNEHLYLDYIYSEPSKLIGLLGLYYCPDGGMLGILSA